MLLKKKEDNKEKKQKPSQKKRNRSISYKEHSNMKFPLINIFPDMEVMAVAPGKKPRNKFNIQLSVFYFYF